VHRDVKPQNILVSQNGLVKVADFGIAKGMSDVSMTEAGTALGTVHYFSPEQAKGLGASPLSDLYSVGIVLYEMLTGRLPFESDTAVGVALKHIEEPVDPPSRYNPQVPPRLESLVLTVLSKEPDQRFQSAREFGEALRSYLEFGQQQTASVSLKESAERIRRTYPLPSTPLGSGGPPIGPAGPSIRTAPPRSVPPPQAQRKRRGVSCTTWLLGLLLLLAILALIPLTLWLFPTLTGGSQNPIIPGWQTPASSNGETVTPESGVTPTATPQGKIEVPDLVGKTFDEAKNMLKDLGLDIQKIDERNDPTIAKGSVIEQTVKAKDQVDKGSVVGVVLSLGKKEITMPPLVNVARTDAEKSLTDQGLLVDVQEQPSTSVPEGVIMQQDPAAGQTVAEGDTVRLVVSVGDKVQMPDVFGMNVEDAVKKISEAGLKVVSINYQTQKDLPSGVDINMVQPGQVLSATPDFNAWVDRGSDVNVAVRARE
jgi:eukaryotic-like serine/threonine-protein kinase